MRILFSAADRSLRALEFTGMAVAIIAFALMLFITVIDVVARYLFSAPLTWSFDLMTSYLMVAGFFMAISAAQASRQHVNIDFVARHFSPRLQAALLAPALVLACIMVGVMAWSGWHGLARAWTRGLVMDGVISWPRWPTFLLLTAGCALLTLRLALEALANFTRALGIIPGLATGASSYNSSPEYNEESAP